MANQSIDEALKQASSPNKPHQKISQDATESINISDDRNDIAKEGYLDGLWASQDYLNGFQEGFTNGVFEGRKRLVRAVKHNLLETREAKLTVDLSDVCGNFPSLEFKPIFALPHSK